MRALMKPKSLQLICFLVVMLMGSLGNGQGSLGAGPKKPRTLAAAGDDRASNAKPVRRLISLIS